jgi:chromate transport protein ChrA
MVLLTRSLELALRFVIMSGLAGLALQLQHGRLHDAILHTVVASVCIVLLAAASHVAKKLLSKDKDDKD